MSLLASFFLVVVFLSPVYLPLSAANEVPLTILQSQVWGRSEDARLSRDVRYVRRRTVSTIIVVCFRQHSYSLLSRS